MNPVRKDLLYVLCKATCSFWQHQILVLPPLPKEQVHQEMWLGIIWMGKTVMSSIWQSCSHQKAWSIGQASDRCLGFSFSPQNSKPLKSSWANLFLISLFCSDFVWLCLSISSSRNAVTPPAPLNFPAAKKQPRQNQQLDWEGRSGGLQMDFPVMHRNNQKDFHNLTSLLEERGNSDIPKA